MNAVVEPEAEAPKVALKPRRPGSVLREERRSQGLSQEEVGEELRLPVRYVNALETGEYSKLPGDTFARGYLRNYAVFLDIDPVPLLEAYARSTKPKKDAGSETVTKQVKSAVKANDDGREGFPVWVVIGVAVALILGAWLSGAFQSDEIAGSSEPASAAVAPRSEATLPDAGMPAETPAGESSSGLPDREAALGSVGNAPEPAMATEAAADVVAQETSLAPGPNDAAVLTPSDSLVIAFSKDCWIRIRDGAGNTLSSGVKKAGEVLTLESGAPYSLLIGNVEGVLVSFNGEPVDLAPYNDKNVAKFILK